MRMTLVMRMMMRKRMSDEHEHHQRTSPEQHESLYSYSQNFFLPKKNEQFSSSDRMKSETDKECIEQLENASKNIEKTQVEDEFPS